MRRRLLILAILLCALPAWAQFTLVSGTVVDPNGLPYAFGTIAPTLVISGSPKFTASNAAYTPPPGPIGLNAAGSFVVQLADVNLLTPSGGTWSFTVSCSNACVQPSGGKGSVSFTISGIVITGATQNISAQLQAAAPALSSSGGGGTSPTPATATFAAGVVTMTTIGGALWTSPFLVGATISVSGCSAGGDNSPPTFTIATGGYNTTQLTYSDASGAAATGCIVGVILPNATPTFAVVTSGTNPNALLVSGTLGPTGGGVLTANASSGTAIAQTGVDISTAFKVVGLNGTNLGTLATGPLCNTTSTGIPFICATGNYPTLNQNTTGTAANLSGTPLLPNGTTVATQTAGDNSQKAASDQFVANALTTFAPTFANLGSGTNSNTLLTSGSLGPTGAGTLSANNIQLAGLMFPANNGVCITGTSLFPKASNCVTNFTSNGQTNGIIYWQPEDVTANPFASNNNFTVYVSEGVGTSTICNTSNVNCIVLEVPLVLGSGVDLLGTAGSSIFSNKVSGGSPITFGSNYPSPDLQPTLPTINCGSNAAGSIGAVGPVFVSEVQADDLNGGAGAYSEGFTIQSAQQFCNFTSGATNFISIPIGTAQTSSNSLFNAQGVYLCAATPTFTGTVNTNGTTTVTFASGSPFIQGIDWQGKLILINVSGTLTAFTIASVANGGATLTTTTTVPTGTGQTYYVAGSAMVCGSNSNQTGTMLCGSNNGPAASGGSCKITSTATLCGIAAQSACLTALPTSGNSGASPTGYIRPPRLDSTNAMIVQGCCDISGNSFSGRIENLALLTPGNNGAAGAGDWSLAAGKVPSSNEPNVVLWSRTTQEMSRLTTSNIQGPFGGYPTATSGGSAGIYWTKGSNSMDSIESICAMNSSAGNNLCRTAVVDGGLVTGGSPEVTIKNSTFNSRTATSVEDAAFTCGGQRSLCTFLGDHMENSQGATAQQIFGDMLLNDAGSVLPHGISLVTVNNGGGTYALGDTVALVQTGCVEALITVTNVSGGVVQSGGVTIAGQGSGCQEATAVATTPVHCAGACSGLTLNVTGIIPGPKTIVAGLQGIATSGNNPAAVHISLSGGTATVLGATNGTNAKATIANDLTGCCNPTNGIGDTQNYSNDQTFYDGPQIQNGVPFSALGTTVPSTLGTSQFCTSCVITTPASCPGTAASCLCASGSGSLTATYENLAGAGAGWYCHQ